MLIINFANEAVAMPHKYNNSRRHHIKPTNWHEYNEGLSTQSAQTPALF